MKKSLTILLIIAMATFGFAGCANKPASSSDISSTMESSITESMAASSESENSMVEESSNAQSSMASDSMISSNATSTNSTATPSTTVSNSTVTSSRSTAPTSAPVARGGNPYKPASPSLSGTISISGSTSVYPVIAALAEAFKAKYKNVNINITNVQGSDAGKEDARANRVSFGMYSADITDPAFNIYKIALDAVVLVVNPANPLTNMSYEQLERVYNTTAGLTVSSVKLGDQLSNWNDLGITYNHPIVAVSRENGSGTRTCFQDIIKGLTAANGKKYPLASGYDSQAGRTEIASSTDQVREKIATNPNAIGYMSLGSINSSVKKISYEGVQASEANVLNGSYKFARPFNLLTRAGDKLTAAEKEFLKYVLSIDGQGIVESSNFISLDSTMITAQLNKIP